MVAQLPVAVKVSAVVATELVGAGNVNDQMPVTTKVDILDEEVAATLKTLCLWLVFIGSRFHVFTLRILGHVPRLTPPAIDQQSSHRSSRGGPPGFAPAHCLRTHAI